MNWKLAVFLFVIVALGGALWFVRRPAPVAVFQDKVSVVASFYPLAFLAQQIGGERVAVTNLTPAGAEPHDFEPTTRDIAAIENSRLFLVNGEGFEPWAEDLQIQNQAVLTVAVAEGLANLAPPEEEHLDPHIWLDPVLASAMAERIAEALSVADPDGRPVYAVNAVTLMASLDQLNREFEAGLSQCRQKSFVTSHAAFGYLAARYGLEQVAISGISPDEEPRPQDLAAVAQFAQANKVTHIFFETLVSPRLAETVAREVGAQTLVLNPIEGLTNEEQSAGQDYFSVQRANLANLKTALDCR